MRYFDYTATTKIDQEVLDTYIKIEQKYYANTTSLHKLGQEANYLLEKATKEILETLKLDNYDLIYTSNATEANNLAIFGIVSKTKSARIITTKIEHPSVFQVYKELENEGFDVVYLDVDNNGVINLKQLEKEINKETALVSIMWVNNIVGSIQPIDEVIEIVKKYPKCRLHVDIVQGFCKIAPNFEFSKVDLLTFSGHKIYGPKGIGGLILKNNIDLGKRLYGSNSQKSIKPGTLSLGLICSLDKAIKKYYPLTIKHYNYVLQLRDYLISQLKENSKIVINTNPNYSSPYIVSISIPTVKGETIVHILEENDIYVSTGSSCSSKNSKNEKTIYAMTNSDVLSTSSIRISLSHLTTVEEINVLLDTLKRI